MSTTASKPTKSSKRRYILLLSVIVLVIAGWSAAWLYGRSVLADQLDRQMNNLAQSGLELTCTDLTIAGYPFRYEVSCQEMQSLDRAGTSSSLEALRAIALIYNPWHVILEAKAPILMEAPLAGFNGEMTWETARASVKFSREALGDLDAVIRKPEVAFENILTNGLISSDKAEIHLRTAPEQADALDGFATIDALNLQSVSNLQETIDLRGHVQISGGTAMLAGADLVTLVRINNGELPVRLVLFEAVIGESRIGANGDLLVNGDGTLSGTLNLTLGNAEQLLQILKPLFPPQNNAFGLVEGVIKSLKSAETQVDGIPTISLPVAIERGVVRVGFLPLGQIPPLFAAGI
ncbi:DUF2125 domain-containing protein [Roseibium sp. SCP14]|uniref:DUF2125 domain-containing protein n=1 Tax=Roseibium sp. SCP14 TaxID=3141375 RepID=UPI0033386D07